MVSLSNHEMPSPNVLRQAQDERRGNAEGFSAGAGRLAGLIPRLLGWPPGEFWNATPAELAAILSASEANLEQPLGRAELEHLLERDNHG